MLRRNEIFVTRGILEDNLLAITVEKVRNNSLKAQKVCVWIISFCIEIDIIEVGCYLSIYECISGIFHVLQR